MKLNSASIFANREAILRCIKEHGFGKVRVYYCGSGDSGGIEDVDVQGMNSDEPIVKLIKAKTSWDRDTGIWSESIGEVEMVLSDAIKEHCYDLLCRQHSGWENNDGGSGEFIFDAALDKIHWTHNEYYTETNTTEQEV